MSRAIVAGWMAMASRDDGRQRITVVDDNREFVEILAEALDGQSVVAACGEPSIPAIAGTRPDVVLFDPWTTDHGQDGWSFIDRMRNHGALRTTPIIVCSTAPLAPDGREQQRNLTDVYFLSKPFGLMELEELLREASKSP